MRASLLLVSLVFATACSSSKDHPAVPASQDSGIASDAAPATDAAADSAKEAGTGTYALSEWVGPVKWTSLHRTGAVDSKDHVFVTDQQNVFQIVDGVATIYLNVNDLAAALGFTDVTRVELRSMDVGPDDKLYMLHSGSEDRILVSDGPSSVTQLHDLSGGKITFPNYMSVVSADRIFVTSREGLQEIGAGTSIKLAYPPATFHGSTDCAAEYLVLTRAAFAFYLPGCTGDDLLGGQTDGSGIGIVAKPGDLKSVGVSGFEGIGRDWKAEGVVINANNVLLRADSSHKVSVINTVPTLSSVITTKGSLEFYDRPTMVGPSGAIYIVGKERIYRAVP